MLFLTVCLAHRDHAVRVVESLFSTVLVDTTLLFQLFRVLLLVPVELLRGFREERVVRVVRSVDYPIEDDDLVGHVDLLPVMLDQLLEREIRVVVSLNELNMSRYFRVGLDQMQGEVHVHDEEVLEVVACVHA